MPVKTKRKSKKSGKVYVGYLVTWTEYESGWGCRSDGASLHLTQEHVAKYLKDYWKSQPKAVPYEYSRQDSDTGELVVISKKLYNALKKKGSTYFWQDELRELRESGDIKQ